MFRNATGDSLPWSMRGPWGFSPPGSSLPVGLGASTFSWIVLPFRTTLMNLAFSVFLPLNEKPERETAEQRVA